MAANLHCRDVPERICSCCAPGLQVEIDVGEGLIRSAFVRTRGILDVGQDRLHACSHGEHDLAMSAQDADCGVEEGYCCIDDHDVVAYSVYDVADQ